MEIDFELEMETRFEIGPAKDCHTCTYLVLASRRGSGPLAVGLWSGLRNRRTAAPGTKGRRSGGGEGARKEGAREGAGAHPEHVALHAVPWEGRAGGAVQDKHDISSVASGAERGGGGTRGGTEDPPQQATGPRLPSSFACAFLTLRRLICSTRSTFFA